MAERIAVAISGGRDSLVAASILASASFDVVTIHGLMTDSPAALQQCDRAREVARDLGLPFEVVDLSAEVSDYVVGPFCAEYAAGRTPNPCVVCNRGVKFGRLLQHALDHGAEKLATGHYARVTHEGGRHRLMRAADRSADQSYFLYAVEKTALERILTPLGDLSKAEVHRLAAALGHGNTASSQDICFVAGRDRGLFIAQRTGAEPGDIVTHDDRILGRHRGLPFYTIGQRHGLRLPATEPLYVVRLDAGRNAVVVGPESDLMSEAALLGSLSWTDGGAPSTDLVVQAQARYRSRGSRAIVSPRGAEAQVRFEEPQRALAPGQSVVFYEGDVVLGGGVIVRALARVEDADAAL